MRSLPDALPPSAPQAAPMPMRALLQTGYGSSDVLRPGTAPRPAPGPGEVLVKVHAAGIDRGTWHLMTGRPYPMRLMGFGFSGPKQPVPGLDLAGRVCEVGPGVTRFQVGDRVFGIGRGSFAEYAVAREDKLARTPGGLSLEEAAVLGVSGITALQALTDQGQVQPGEKVLVLGASGGVGTYAVQLARALGAEVTAVCSAGKADLVRSLGVARVLDYRTDDFADGSARYDLILDVGGNTPLSRLRRALGPTGRLVFVGGEQGGDWSGGFGRQLGALLLQPFVRQKFLMQTTQEHCSHLERLAAFCERGQVKPVLDRRVGLEQVGEALRAMEAGRIAGKVVVAVA